MSTSPCCGRARADECRCRTEAAAIAQAVHRYVARRVRRPHDAEDVTQEALLHLYRSAESLQDEQAIEAWMYRIAANAVTDHYRRSAHRSEPLDPADVVALAPAATADPPRPEEELAACLTPLLERVAEDYRAAIELTDLGGMTQEAAAAQLGLSTSGMKSRVQRGRQMLRVEVGRCCRVELDARGALSEVSIREERGSC